MKFGCKFTCSELAEIAVIYVIIRRPMSYHSRKKQMGKVGAETGRNETSDETNK